MYFIGLGVKGFKPCGPKPKKKKYTKRRTPELEMLLPMTPSGDRDMLEFHQSAEEDEASFCGVKVSKNIMFQKNVASSIILRRMMWKHYLLKMIWN